MLVEWNIEDKLFAVTFDNTSNNNAMMKLLKSNLLEKKMLLGKGKLLHQRCAAHVLNLICKAGLEIINPIVHKIRESVKYVQGSTSRKQKFEEIIQQDWFHFRSRLSPKTVEELMCLQDWFHASDSTKFSMESIDRCLLDESNEL